MGRTSEKDYEEKLLKEEAILQYKLSKKLGKKSAKEWMEHFLWIYNKAGKKVKLKLNSSQRKIDEIIEREQVRKGKPVRAIIVKSRQIGVSTYTEGRVYRGMNIFPNTRAEVVADSLDTTDVLFEKILTFHQYQFPQPKTDLKGKKGIRFVAPLNSRCRVERAEKITGISRTIQHLICSEVAYWGKYQDGANTLLDSIPYLPDTTIIVESTGNGRGGFFHRLWQSAVAGENTYIPIFLAWFEHEEYVMQCAGDEVWEDNVNGKYGDEVALMEKHPEITPEAMKWRRWCIFDDCGGDKTLFKIKYPSIADDAFISLERKAIPLEWVDAGKEFSKAPKLIGEIVDQEEKPIFYQVPNGTLSIWTPPEKKKQYVIGVDVSAGLEKNVSGIIGDYCSAVVIKRGVPLVQVARLYGHIPPDILAGKLKWLGLYYNTALIGVERNAQGMIVLDRLERFPQQQYWNLYRKFVKGSSPASLGRSTAGTGRSRTGWQTSASSKKQMVEDLKKVIRDSEIIIPDIMFWEECLNIDVAEDGRYIETQQHIKTDVFMSMCIAIQMHLLGAGIEQFENEKNKSAEEKQFDMLVNHYKDADPQYAEEVEVWDDDVGVW